jgi:hypothetical protein
MLSRMNEIELVFWAGNGIVTIVALLLGFGHLAAGDTPLGLSVLCIPLVSFFNGCIWFVKEEEMIRRKVS